MPIPDYDHEARRAAKMLGSRLVRAPVDEATTLYGWVEFAQWSAASPDGHDRRHWYEVRFEPLGTRWNDTWRRQSASSDAAVNRLHFSVLERAPGHPEGAGSVAKLGPIGHIRTEPKSAGIGTYLRDQLIDWVASEHPQASVAEGSLSPVDAGPDNLERRNNFYLGAKFQVRVQEDGSGAFWADRMDGLKRHTENRKVVELARDDIQQLLQSVPELEKAKLQGAHLDGANGQLRTEIARARARLFWAKMAVFAVLVLLLIATAQGKLTWHMF